MLNLSHKQADNQLSFKITNWWIISSILVTIIVGGSVALVVGQMGLFALLIIPALIIFISALIEPNLGLIGFIIITYIQLSDVLIVFHGLPSIAQPAAGVLAIIIAFRFLFHKEWPLKWSQTAIVLGIYLLAMYASILVADDFHIAFDAFYGFAKDLLGGVLVFLLIRRHSSFRSAIWALIVSGLFMGSISVFQYLTGTFNNLYFGFGGWLSDFSGGVARERLTGPFANPNAYSQVLIVVIPLTLERLWHEKKFYLRLMAGTALFVCVLTIVYTFSRGGFLTLVATLSVLFVLFRPRAFPILITAAIAFVFLQFIPSSYIDRVTTLFQLSSSRPSLVADQSFQGRLSENLAAIEMFRDRPLFGVGIGNYSIKYQDYSRAIGLDSRRVPRTPASLYLEILSEQGLVGIFIFIILLVYVFRGSVRAYNKFRCFGSIEESNILKAFLAGLLGYLIAATTKNSAYANAFWVLIGIAIGAIHLSDSLTKSRPVIDERA